MISPALCPTLTLLLIIATIFTVSLSETLELADAISVSADKIKFDIELGETQLLFWHVRNTDPYPIDLEFYATGPGAELLVFEQFGHLEIKERISYEILASIPIDHKDNVEYRPVLHVLQRSQDPNSISNSEEGARFTAVATVNVVMKTVPIIRIGDNPIYTPPVIIPEEKEEEPKFNPALEKAPTAEEKEQVESIQQKLDRIQAANQAKAPKEVIVDDVFEEAFEEEAVVDYEPEPIAEDYKITRTETTKVECGFLDWFLSLFGFGKC